MYSRHSLANGGLATSISLLITVLLTKKFKLDTMTNTLLTGALTTVLTSLLNCDFENMDIKFDIKIPNVETEIVKYFMICILLVIFILLLFIYITKKKIQKTNKK